uniref:Uncharacterized protein n=1 Tax=Cacopsylla melanoneura TaxID=428564 RepID=A0A8D8YF39_9HEMI
MNSLFTLSRVPPCCLSCCQNCLILSLYCFCLTAPNSCRCRSQYFCMDLLWFLWFSMSNQYLFFNSLHSFFLFSDHNLVLTLLFFAFSFIKSFSISFSNSAPVIQAPFTAFCFQYNFFSSFSFCKLLSSYSL